MQIKKMKTLGRIISRYKYPITIVLGIAIVGFVDENSFIRRWEYNYEIKDLRSEISKYNAQYERDSSRLGSLKNNHNAIKKVARERYFMKADDEDIFVLSDDNKNETEDEAAK